MDSVVLNNEEEGTVTIFAVNKNLEEDADLSCDLRQFADYQLQWQKQLQDEDLKAVNTENDPTRIQPEMVEGASFENGMLKAVLKSKSWNVIRLAKA